MNGWKMSGSEYGVQTGLVPECERIYTTNLIENLNGKIRKYLYVTNCHW